MNPTATILLVEDDPGIARLERGCLQRAGYAVVTAMTAEEGLQAVRGGGIDLILLDQRLPRGADGLAFYRQLRDTGCDVPAILVTGFQDEALLVEAIRAGIRDFVPKTPNFVNHLEPIVTRVLLQVANEHELIASRVRAREIEARQRELEREIAERRKVEAQLRESEQRYRSLAESLPLFVWRRQPDGRIDYINRAWYEYTGSPPHGPDDTHWIEYVHPDDRALIAERRRAAFESGQPFEVEVRIRDARGRYRWFASRAVPYRDEEGRIVHWIGTSTDIDDRKRMEEALRAADRRKDEFLAMLGHELRNPLAPITNAVEILEREGRDSPNFDWSIGVIEDQVRHLSRLVDDLLDVARITSGKVVLRPERVELARVIDQAVQICRPMIEANGLALDLALPAEPLVLEADPARLAQVLSNLLNNAAKYTDRGGRIALQAERDNGRAIIRVQDNGIGIAPELLPRVFELFAQGDQTLSRSRGGLGIGLTLVKTLVELHGGQVCMQSAGIGQGCQVVVTLPLAGGPQVARPSGGASLPTPRNAPLPRRRILIVDDNRGNVQGLAILLRSFGQEVLTAHDGRSAITQARQHRPELVLLDIGLPDLDGYDVLRLCRAAPGLEQTRFVAMTGYGQEEDRRRSREAGFHAHLVKPVALEALRELVLDPVGMTEQGGG